MNTLLKMKKSDNIYNNSTSAIKKEQPEVHFFIILTLAFVILSPSISSLLTISQIVSFEITYDFLFIYPVIISPGLCFFKYYFSWYRNFYIVGGSSRQWNVGKIF